MLNQRLYDALEKVFGEVGVVNPDVEAEIQVCTSLGRIRWNVRRDGEHGEQYRVNCPFCKGRDGLPDHNGHLYISYMSLATPTVHGTTLPMGRLLARCMRANCVADPQNMAQLEQMIYAGFACDGSNDTRIAVTRQTITTETSDTYSNSITLSGIKTWAPDYTEIDENTDNAVTTYLDSRGIDLETARQFGIGYGSLYSTRTAKPLCGAEKAVIVPIAMNGKLRGIQARFLPETAAKYDMRYYTHPGLRKSTVVYNLDTARALGLAVVCEGVFDVFHVGAPGVCCFGHLLSRQQKALLATVGEGIIVLPDTDAHSDFDAVKEAEAVAAAWNCSGVFRLGAHVVVLPAKDPGEMIRKDIWAHILAAVPDKMQEFIMSNILDNLGCSANFAG